MGFRQILEGAGFIKMVEVLPPKGPRGEDLERRLVPMKGLIHCLYIPHLQGAVMRASSLATAHYLRGKGFEAVFEVNGAHQNRLAIQAELLGAGILGLDGVMVLEGDHPQWGDHPEGKPVYDLDLEGILSAIRAIKEGKDLGGGDLEGRADFCVGTKADASLKDDDLEREWERMGRLVEAGVEFFVTTPVYDLGQLARFMEGARGLGVPVLAGVVLLKSAGMARYMNKHIPGVLIPEGVIERLLKAPDRAYESVRIAAEAMRELKGLCQGVNLIPIGWEDKVPQVLEEAEG